MTSGLGQQQFNLSNLSAREHLPRFREDRNFCIIVISADDRELGVRLVTSVVEVELFEKRLSILTAILKAIQVSFIVSGEGDASRYRTKSATILSAIYTVTARILLG